MRQRDAHDWSTHAEHSFASEQDYTHSTVEDRKEHAEGICLEASSFTAAGDYEAASLKFRELKQVCRRGAMERLAELLCKVVEIASSYHAQDNHLADAQYMSPSPASSYICARNIAAHTEPPMMSPQGSVRAKSSSFVEWAHKVRDGLCRVHDFKTALPEFVSQAAGDADAWLAAVLEFVCLVHQPLRSVAPDSERYITIVPTVRRLRHLQEKVGKSAEDHKLFADPLLRLKLEAQLLEALLSAEFKISLLQGVDAFAHLSQAEQHLHKYLDAPRRRSEFIGASVVSRKSHLSYSSAQSNPPGLPKLESWYVWFYAHVLGHLRLICGAGFQAAARFGPKQIETQGQVGSVDTIVPLPSQVQPAQRCNYLEDLSALAAHPGVAFVGVFANAGQLPHLHGWHRQTASRGTSSANASLAAPFGDPSWLLAPASAAGTSSSSTATPDTNEFEWWTLAFAAADTSNSPGKRVREAMSGQEALEAWRHTAELKNLRESLTAACKDRHALRRAMSQSRQHSWSFGSPRALTSSRLAAAISQSAANVGPPTPLSLRKGRYAPRDRERADGVSSPRPPGSPRLGMPPQQAFATSPVLTAAPQPFGACASGMLPSSASRIQLDFSSGDLGSPTRRLNPSAFDSGTSMAALGNSMAAPDEHVFDVQGLLVDVPDAPKSTWVPGSGGDDSGSEAFRCLVVPMDVGWCPSPVFLGVVVRDVASTPMPIVRVASIRANSRATGIQPGPRRRTPRIGVFSNSGERPQVTERQVSCDLAASPDQGKPKWWQKVRQLWDGALGGGNSASVDGEGSASTFEHALLDFACAASGRKLRLSSGAPPSARQ